MSVSDPTQHGANGEELTKMHQTPKDPWAEKR